MSTILFGCSLLYNTFSQLLIAASALVMATAVTVSSGMVHAQRLVISAPWPSVVSVG